MQNIKHLKTNFKILPLSENERGKAVQFAQKSEIECTALMEQLLKSAEDIYVLKETQTDVLCALFYLRNKSTLFHFIPFLKDKENFLFDEIQLKELRDVVKEFLSVQKLFCIYGEYDGGKYINSILEECGKIKIAENEYKLLKNDLRGELFSKPIEERNDVIVRKCSSEDAENLIELERGYRTEEVAITENVENDRIIRFILSKTLNTHTVFVAYKMQEGILKAVAKAATNACGNVYCQIGGVYTCKEERNKGIMFYVMLHLLRYIKAQNKESNLFVKIHNESAKKVYAKLGYKEIGKYMISYFQK